MENQMVKLKTIQEIWEYLAAEEELIVWDWQREEKLVIDQIQLKL